MRHLLPCLALALASSALIGVPACTASSTDVPDEPRDGSSSSDVSSGTTNPSNDATSPNEQPPSEAGADADTTDRCPDGFPRGTAGEVRQIAKLSPAPEGVAACENGDVFVTLPGTAQVLRVPLEGGEPEVWTTLTGRQPLGLTCSENVLWIADFGSNDASVIRVAAKDDPGTALPNIAGSSFRMMNSVAVVKGVGVYATDRTQLPPGRIVRFEPTTGGAYEAGAVTGNLNFPNDIKFDPTTNSLDVSFTLGTEIKNFPIQPDGTLGASKVVWTGGGLLDAIDGIARDEKKSLYVAHYLQNYVGRTTDKKKIASFKSPKSLVFRGGTLLMTGESGLFAAPLGICGVR